MTKKIIAIIFVIISIAMLFTACKTVTTEETTDIRIDYTLSTKVFELDEENDVVTVEDENGNLWDFYGCEDWLINDNCILLMNNNNTSNIYDDIIIRAIYTR